MAKLIIKTRIKVVILTCEYCNIRKEIIFVLKQNSIPTIALQHGHIVSLLWRDFYSNPKNQDYLPDITCVYGDADKEFLLTNGIYTPDQLVVTGSPRYDIIYHAANIYSRDKFCKKYGLSVQSHIILWPTQTHGRTDEEKFMHLDIVFGACDLIPDTTLVIKQHPGERKKDSQLITSYQKKHQCKSIIIPKDSDTFEAIFASDLVITFHSTTGREAVAFQKPLVVLDPDDQVGYIRDGVGMGIFSIPQAVDTISFLLKDDSTLAVNREYYIKRYFFAIDGKSTERVVRVIEKCYQNR
ncbi:CDP-glycerol glycerophosphotransferase family protein [Methanospirillum sp.]